jgi:transposase
MNDLEHLTKEELIRFYLESQSTIESLSSTNEEQKSMIKEQESTIKALESKIEIKEQEYLTLLEQIKASRKKAFDSSSETRTLNKLNLFEKEDVEIIADISGSLTGMDEVIEATPNKQKAKKTRVDYSNLHTVDLVLDLSDDEKKSYGANLTYIGEEVIERIRMKPAEYYIERTHVYKYKLEHEDGTSTEIISKTRPIPLLERSKVSSEVVSHAIYEKVCMGTPFYRQSVNLKSMGIDLHRQNLTTWSIKATDLYLQPLAKMMVEDMRELDVLHMDETTLKIIEKGSKGYVWLVMSGKHEDKKMAMYFYKDNRNHAHATDILGDFKGYLHTDGYQAYSKIEDVINVGCFAHARRYFNEALELDEGYKAYKQIKDLEELTTYLDERKALKHKVMSVHLINQLFELERQFESLSDEMRYKQRQDQSAKVVNQFFDFIKVIDTDFPPKSKMGKAILYAINQEKQLRNYLLDGRLELSNNQAERLIKPFVMGRKNFLFSATTNGAHATTLNYSIMESAKLNGLKPEAYLTYVFDQMTGKKMTDELVRSLLPYSKSLPKHLYLNED